MGYNRGGNDRFGSGGSRRAPSPRRVGPSTASSSNGGGSLSSRFGRVEQERRGMGQGSSNSGNRNNSSAGSQRQRMPFGGVASTSSSAPSRRGRGRGGASQMGTGPVRKPRQNRRSNMMDIDQPPTGGRPVGRFPRTTTDDGPNGQRKGKKVGRGGAVAGRGGKRGGASAGGRRRGGKKAAPLNRENLDMDLDNYMMRDEKTAKVSLDQDLDDYMMGMTDIPQQIGA